MKVPIKFRGKSCETGEYVYGDAVHVKIKPLYNEEYDKEEFDDIWIVTNVTYFENVKLEWMVETQYTEIEDGTLQQLVGYDDNGNEIYSDC